MDQTILTRNEVYIILLIFKALVISVFYLVRNMHKEGIGELKGIKGDLSTMKEDIHELRKDNALSNYKLDEGSREFQKIHNENRDRDLKIDRNNELLNNLDSRVTKLEVINEQRKENL